MPVFTDGPQIDPDMPPNLRPTLFSGSALMLDLLKLYTTALELDAESVWILLYVTEQSMQEFLLDPARARAWTSATVVSDTVRGWVSRRSVAENTGLPRETVRRKMATLIAKGLIAEDDLGRIRIRNDGWETDDLKDFARQLDDCVRRYHQRCATIRDFVK